MTWTIVFVAVLAVGWWLFRMYQDREIGAHAGKRALDRLHQPRALPDTTDFAEGVHGLHPDVWLDPARAAARWREFEKAGPGYALPGRTVVSAEGIPTCNGPLYVALFPTDRFEDLMDFDLFLRYASSVHRDVIRTGTVDRSSFVPPDRKTVLEQFSSRLGRVARSPKIPELEPVLQRMELPPDAEWVLDLDCHAWTISWSSAGLKATAATTQGYLHLFVVVDA